MDEYSQRVRARGGLGGTFFLLCVCGRGLRREWVSK